MFDSPRKRLIQLLWWFPWAALLVILSSFFQASSAAWTFAWLVGALTLGSWLLAQRYLEIGMAVYLGGAMLLAGWYAGAFAGSDLSTSHVFALLMFVPLVAVNALWGPVLGAIPAIGAFIFLMLRVEPSSIIALKLLVFAIASGLILSKFVTENELVHRALLEVMLTDPTTGLGNLRAFTKDFKRYQSLSQRNHQPLLLCRWQFESRPLAQTANASPHSLLGFAELLNDSSRLGDSLYYLGEDEFVGLHLGLETGFPLAQRLKQVYPLVSVTWTLIGVKSLDQVLAEVRQISKVDEPASTEPSTHLPQTLN